jgi:hypothetical protein
MAIDEQAAPAGAVTETPAPATEVADLPRPLDAPLTGAAAAKLLAEWEPDSPELPLSNPNTPSEPEAVAAAEEPVEAAQPDSEEEEAVPANEEKAEPETEEPDDKFVHGNAKTRRSDGSVVTVGELKKKADLAEEYERVKPQLEQQFRQLQAREAQLAQREQYAQPSSAACPAGVADQAPTAARSEVGHRRPHRALPADGSVQSGNGAIPAVETG